MEQAGKAVGLASGVVAGLRLPQEVVAAARSAFANYEQAARASSAERAEPPDTAPGPSALATAALFAEYVWSEGAAAVAAAIFEAFEETYCSGQNIHAQAHDAGIEGGQAEAVLRAYYAARDMYIRARGALAVPVPRQALFSTPQFRILAAFGGQGGMDNYIDEARTVFSIYRPLVVDFVLRMSDFLKREAAEPQFARHYPHGLDAMRWILSPEDTPAQEYMVTVPVCIPLVGLVQLMHVVVLYKSLVISPAELADRFQCKL
ncbi:hypothetical protein LPJ61_002351 [Coemansia biformis]|uniref:Uncharacterized protein n=1 Tax=Coemansia biformis TaxID=1286918 RepID=A0A9W7YEY6_9FUNG|nr:hypothetical protein LPJ61_002351 [Coemansia biformis]